MLDDQEYTPLHLDDARVQPHYEGKDKVLNVLFIFVYGLAFEGAILTGAGFVIFMATGIQGPESIAAIFIDRMIIFGLPFVLCIGAAIGVRLWRRSRPQKLQFTDSGHQEHSMVIAEHENAAAIEEAINE